MGNLLISLITLANRLNLYLKEVYRKKQHWAGFKQELQVRHCITTLLEHSDVESDKT